MIRKAKDSDKSELFAAAKSYAKTLYPQRHLDVERLHALIRELVGNPSHYARVIEDENQEVKGALLALTNDHVWAQRKQSHVLLWFSEIKGEGSKLLQDYVQWVKGQRAVKVAGLQPDFPISERAVKIAEQSGFKQYGGAYLLYN